MVHYHLDSCIDCYEASFQNSSMSYIVWVTKEIEWPEPFKTLLSLISFGAGVFWQSEFCKNIHHFHVAIQTPKESIGLMSQAAVKPANESLSLNTVQPKMEQLCFQLTAGANYSNFALGDAIHCRHWDLSGSLKVRDPLSGFHGPPGLSKPSGNSQLFLWVAIFQPLDPYSKPRKYCLTSMRFIEDHVLMELNLGTVSMLA